MIVTLAPTIADFVWSETMPCREVVPDWAMTPAAVNIKTTTLATTRTAKLRSINARKYMYCSFRAPFRRYETNKEGASRKGRTQVAAQTLPQRQNFESGLRTTYP